MERDRPLFPAGAANEIGRVSRGGIG